MPLVEQSWSEVFEAQSENLAASADAAAVRDYVEKMPTRGVVALGDRNNLDDLYWRHVMIYKAADALWILCDRNGEVLHEPEYGCPRYQTGAHARRRLLEHQE